MINLNLRDEIQTMYLFIDTYLPILSMKSERKESKSWAAKISLSIPNK